MASTKKNSDSYISAINMVVLVGLVIITLHLSLLYSVVPWLKGIDAEDTSTTEFDELTDDTISDKTGFSRVNLYNKYYRDQNPPNKRRNSLRRIRRLDYLPSCEKTVKSWMKRNPLQINRPRKIIPKNLRNGYTMDGQVKILRWFFETEDTPVEKFTKRSFNYWSTKEIQYHIRRMKRGQWHSGSYKTDSVAHAMNAYRPNGTGMVIGSLIPWIETAALYFGADSILTSTYNPLVSQDPRIKTINPFTLVANASEYFDEFDWAASYSSIEHSGLGRYGDSLDPYGDIIETQKVRCFLKTGGLFYLGVPMSSIDKLVWNAHRIYGPIRLPYLLSGFKLLAIYQDTRPGGTSKKINLLNAYTVIPNDEYHYTTQHTFVLQKTD